MYHEFEVSREDRHLEGMYLRGNLLRELFSSLFWDVSSVSPLACDMRFL